MSAPFWRQFAILVPPTLVIRVATLGPKTCHLPKRLQKIRFREYVFAMFSKMAPETAQDRF